MNWWNIYTKIIFAVILILAVVIVLSFIIQLPYDSSQYARFQSYLSVISATGVISTLIYATVQFRRTIAKPKIVITYDEKGTTERDIIVPIKDRRQTALNLVVTNKGNAVASIFQIDLEMPSIYQPEEPQFHEQRFSKEMTHNRSYKENTTIISFYNNGLPFFVNKPIGLSSLSFILNAADSAKYSSSFTINYKVFGNWAEKQEGSLTIKCVQEKSQT
jgi:hypothetical protein